MLDDGVTCDTCVSDVNEIGLVGFRARRHASRRPSTATRLGLQQSRRSVYARWRPGCRVQPLRRREQSHDHLQLHPRSSGHGRERDLLVPRSRCRRRRTRQPQRHQSVPERDVKQRQAFRPDLWAHRRGPWVDRRRRPEPMSRTESDRSAAGFCQEADQAPRLPSRTGGQTTGPARCTRSRRGRCTFRAHLGCIPGGSAAADATQSLSAAKAS